MSKNIDKVIKQADALIKEERYAEAWKLLIPHKNDENTLKRLKWLKSKNEQLTLEQEIAESPIRKDGINGWFERLGVGTKVVLGVFILCSGCTACSMFAQWSGFVPDTPVAEQEESTRVNIVIAPSEEATLTTIDTLTPTDLSVAQGIEQRFATETATQLMFTPSPTITNTSEPAPTSSPALLTTYALYDPNDVCLDFVAQTILDLLKNTEGVDFVDNLCIQTFGNSTTLYAEIIVYPSYNALIIPQMVHDASVSALQKPDLDTTINMSDGISAIAYTNSAIGDDWGITVYTNIVPPTPRPRTNTQAVVVQQATIAQASPTIAPSQIPSGQTYYANTPQTRVRLCPRRDCETLHEMIVGEAIQVISETTGDTVSNSNRWYEVNRNGEIGYVHSSLLQTQRPVATVASSSAQNPPPVSQQSQWNCNGNIYNCGDFGNSCEQVMSYWNACPNDPSGLDDAPGPDGDGSPCESICGG